MRRSIESEAISPVEPTTASPPDPRARATHKKSKDEVWLAEVDTNLLCAVWREQMARYSKLQSESTRLQEVVMELKTDLDEQKARVRQAEYLARHDSLTGLLNRASLQKSLEEKLSLANGQGQTMALLYVDIKNFKSINDAFGLTVGDAVLCIVSARLCHALGAEDIVGRVGGNEFVCLLTGFTSRGQIRRAVQKVIDAVAATERVNGMDINLLISIGIALYPENGRVGERLLAQADTAMYYSKKMGTAYAFYDELPATPEVHPSSQ